MNPSHDISSHGEGIPIEEGVEAAEDSPTTVPIGSSAPSFLTKEDARTIKKRRLVEPGQDNEYQNMNLEQNAVMVPESASFAGLPFDILETILEQTGYLGDVVSVSRTCKLLRDKLKSQSAFGLWRRLRNAIGIPDPFDFSEQVEGSSEVLRVERFIGKEAEFAAFIFGEGDCEFCGKTSKRMLVSFALGLRLCGNNDCRQQIEDIFQASHGHNDSAFWAKVIPTLETRHLIDSSGSTRFWPHGLRITRKEWVQKWSLQEPLDTQEKAVRIARTRAWMKFCVALCKWRDHWQGTVRRVRKRNENLARRFAKDEGWEYNEMLSETSYGQFQEMKSKRREEITEKDLEKMRPDIARELYEFKEKRGRKKMMRLRESNKKDIWKHYQKLMSQPQNYPILPPFTLFLKLPSIVLLQSSNLRDAKIDVRTAVRSKGFLKAMIHEEVEKWAEKAKRQMLETIGGSTTWNHMVATRRMPHPVLRLNARWKCNICHNVEPKYENDGCLDFAGICRHQCKERTKKKRGEEGSVAWSLDNFVQDEQACSALTSCLQHVEGESEEPSNTLRKMEEKYWRCTSCDPPIIVRAQNIAGHSHRHPVPMQIQLVEQHIIWTMKPQLPNPTGVSQWLKQSSQDAKLWAHKANYGCQYCKKTEEMPVSGQGEEETVPSSAPGVHQTSDTTPPIDVVMEDGNNEGDGANGTELGEGTKATATNTGTQKSKVFENKFDFNGLRSHLSSKHKIYQIRDEDFWCHEPISTFKTRDIILPSAGWPFVFD